MKILILGSHMNYNLEHYVYMNLERLNHEIKFYGYSDRLGKLANWVRIITTRSVMARNLALVPWLNSVNEEIKRLAAGFLPDLILSIKGEAVRPETIAWAGEELGVKTALWYPDDPRFFKSLVRYIAPVYDVVLVTSENAVEMYKKIGCNNVHYLPFACEPSVHRKLELGNEEREDYESDVCFVGAYTSRRAKIIKSLRKTGRNIKVWGPYWKYFFHGDWVGDGIYGPEMVRAFNAAKTVLNIHMESDLGYKPNMRTFEAAGSEAFLLTDLARGIERLFEVGSEIVGYKDERELFDLLEYYSNAEEERRAVALKAKERAYKEHTYKQRLESLLRLVA